MNLKTNKYSLYIAFIVLSFNLSTMGIWSRMMKDTFTNGQQVFWRCFIAALVLLFIFGRNLKIEKLKQITLKQWASYFVRAQLNFGVGVMLFTVVVLKVEISVVIFILGLPVMGLLSWIISREKLKAASIPFILLSIVGLFLIAKMSLNNFHIERNTILMLICLLGFDTSYLLVKYHNKSFSNVQNTTLMFAFSWIIPLAYIIFESESIFPSSLSIKSASGVVISVAFNICNTYLLNYVFTNMKGYVAGNVLLVEGIFGIILGYLIYDEVLELNQALGAVIIIICTIAISRIDSKRSELPIEA